MRRAFTLIEILIVVGIIAILASLLVTGIALIRQRTRVLQTVQRIDDVLATVARQGVTSGSIAYNLQTQVPGIAGTAAFARDAASDVSKPVGGAWHACFPDPAAVAPGHVSIQPSGAGKPLVMAYPWGQGRLYFIREGWYTTPLSLSDQAPELWTPAEREAWAKPEQHRIQELWPGATPDLMTWLKVVPDAATWKSDRVTKRAWNDAWGNPLLLAYALYQPPKCTMPAAAIMPTDDAYLVAAHRLYRSNRILYVAVGAVGPFLDPARFPGDSFGSDWPADIAALWAQVTEVSTAGHAWDEHAFDKPPWSGTRQGRASMGGRDLLTFLSSPSEFR